MTNTSARIEAGARAWVTCALLSAAVASGAPLSLQEAVSEAKGHGFDVRAAEAAITEAKGDLEAAGALPNPTVSLSAGPSIGCYGAGCRSGSPTLGAQLSDQGALGQLLAGKRELRERVARSGVEVAQVARLDVERLLTSLVKQQFVGAVIAERTTLFSREVRDAARQTAELTRERYRAGAVDEADVSRVETQYLEAEQALDASRQNAEQQRSALRLLLGRPALEFDSVELDARPFLPVHPIESLSGLSVQALVTRALEARTDVRAQEAMVTQAEAAVASLQRQRLPDVSLFAGYTQQGLAPDFSSPPNVTFGVSLPVPVAYRLSGEIAHATAAVTAQRAQLDKVHAQVRNDVETAWVAYQTALSQLRRMDQGLLRSAARARELVSVQYDKGAASLIEFLDAQRTFVAINVEYLSVLQEYWTAVFHLEAALGQELPS